MNVKNAIKKVLPQFATAHIRNVRFRPRGVRMGKGSYLIKPLHIVGRQFISVGERCLIQSKARFISMLSYAGTNLNPRIEIGDDVYIGNDFHVVSGFGVRIGSGCVLSDSVYINDTDHGMDPALGLIMNQQLTSKGNVEIGECSFVGYRSILLSGVALGHHCTVAAGSVVTRSFPEYSVIGGVPARLIKTGRLNADHAHEPPPGADQFNPAAYL